MGVRELRVRDISFCMEEQHDRVVMRFRDGERFEPESTDAWLDSLVRGEAAVDVGAYTGFYTILAGLSGCGVMAVEPLPQNAERARKNFYLNDCCPCLVQKAASSSRGRATLHYNRSVTLTSGASLLGTGSAAIEVDTFPLDAYEDFFVDQRLCAIKIDAERSEVAVAIGAQALIKRHRPVVLAETLDTDTRMALLDALPAYRVAAILDGRNTLFVPN